MMGVLRKDWWQIELWMNAFVVARCGRCARCSCHFRVSCERPALVDLPFRGSIERGSWVEEAELCKRAGQRRGRRPTRLYGRSRVTANRVSLVKRIQIEGRGGKYSMREATISVPSSGRRRVSVVRWAGFNGYR